MWTVQYEYSYVHILVHIILVHIILVHVILVHIILVHIILVHIILVHIWRKSYIWVRYNICGWGISGRVDDGIRYTLHISTTCQYFLKEDEILTKERSFSFQKSFLTEWTVQRNERVAVSFVELRSVAKNAIAIIGLVFIIAVRSCSQSNGKWHAARSQLMKNKSHIPSHVKWSPFLNRWKDNRISSMWSISI